MCYQGPEFWPKEDRMFPDREPISGYGGGFAVEDNSTVIAVNNLIVGNVALGLVDLVNQDHHAVALLPFRW